MGVAVPHDVPRVVVDHRVRERAVHQRGVKEELVGDEREAEEPPPPRDGAARQVFTCRATEHAPLRAPEDARVARYPPTPQPLDPAAPRQPVMREPLARVLTA